MKGVNYPYGEARKQYPVAGGRFLSPLDEAERRRVIFLGNELAEDLFGKDDPVGQTLLVANAPFTVDRRHAEEDADGGLRRDGQGPLHHPDHDLEGALRPARR